MELAGNIGSFVVSLVALAVSCVVAYLYVRSVVDQTRKQYHDNLPDVQMTDLSGMSSENSLTLFPTFRNLGKAPAYDCTLSMDGWEDRIEIGTSYPLGPRFQEHKVSLVLGPESALRSQVINPAYLYLRYRDCWGQRYGISYPVTQRKQGSIPFYGVEIDSKSPRYVFPNPSFFEMRKLLRNLPQRQ